MFCILWTDLRGISTVAHSFLSFILSLQYYIRILMILWKTRAEMQYTLYVSPCVATYFSAVLYKCVCDFVCKFYVKIVCNII